MGIVIDITGDKALIKELKKLGPAIQSKIAKKAVLAQAGVVRKAAKSRVPVKSGTLRRGIVSRFARPGSRLWKGLPIKQRRDFLAYVTGVFYAKGKTGKAWYGRFLEFGTKRHQIPRRSRKGRGYIALGPGGRIGRYSPDDPLWVKGVTKRPWLEPALRATKAAQIAAQNKAIGTWLKKWKQGKFK